MKQTRPFQAIITEDFKLKLREDSKRFNCHYGVFFDTSGKLRSERINPTARYHYIFRTDGACWSCGVESGHAPTCRFAAQCQ